MYLKLIFLGFNLMYITYSQVIKPHPIKLLDKCDKATYLAFTDALKRIDNPSNFDVLNVLKITPHPDPSKLEKLINYLDELCFEAFDTGVIDHLKYDCKTGGELTGKCSCGIRMSEVDLRNKQPQDPIPPPGVVDLRVYNKVIGLDQKIMFEDGKCVSNAGGHCTLQENIEARKAAGAPIMECRKDYTCRDFSNLRNDVTNEEYGNCGKGDDSSKNFTRSWAVPTSNPPYHLVTISGMAFFVKNIMSLNYVRLIAQIL